MCLELLQVLAKTLAVFHKTVAILTEYHKAKRTPKFWTKIFWRSVLALNPPSMSEKGEMKPRGFVSNQGQIWKTILKRLLQAVYLVITSTSHHGHKWCKTVVYKGNISFIEPKYVRFMTTSKFCFKMFISTVYFKKYLSIAFNMHQLQ